MSLLTMILFMVIAFTSNIGKLVTERIAIQNAADLAAYAGAATQAGLMNKLREHNHEIYSALNEARTLLERTDTLPAFGTEMPCAGCYFPMTVACPNPLTNSPAENLINNVTRTRIQTAQARFQATLARFPTSTRSAAQQTANANFPGVNVQPLGGSLAPPRVSKSRVDVDYRGWGYVAGGSTCPFNGAPVGSIHVNKRVLDSWYYRTPGVRGEVMFAVRVTGTPQGRFFDGGYLGTSFGCGSTPGSRCRLTALAAALPVAGKLGAIRGGQYTVAREQLWDAAGPAGINNLVQVGQGQVDTSAQLSGARVRGGSFTDYRVRYVGIFEREASWQNGVPLTTFDMGGKVRH